MFLVLGIFNLFVAADKPTKAVPPLFIAVIFFAGVLGNFVAHGYSEPMNRWLRKRWGDVPMRPGSVIASDETFRAEESCIIT